MIDPKLFKANDPLSHKYFSLPSVHLPSDSDEKYQDLRDHLEEALGMYEVKRKRAYTINVALWTVFAVVVLPLLFLLGMKVNGIIFPLILAVITGTLISMSGNSYLTSFKKDIIQIIFGRMGVIVKHDAFSAIEKQLFERSSLFRDTNTYRGEDYIVGRRGDVIFSTSEFKASKVTGSGKSKKETPKFEGIYFHAKLPFTFQGITTISTKNFKYKDKAKIPAQKFEFLNKTFGQIFNLSYTSYDEASYLLSQGFMNELVNFQQIHKHPFILRVSGDDLYLAINENRDFFHWKLYHSAENELRFKVLYADCRFFVDLLDCLVLICK